MHIPGRHIVETGNDYLAGKPEYDMLEKLEPNPDGFFSIQDEWSGEENVTCTYTFHEYFIPDEAWEGGFPR